jgi:hypothetical protein
MAKQSKNSRKVRSKPTKPRVRNVERPRKRNVVNVDPFIHCVLGPLDRPGKGVGCPDGSPDPSIVVEHRQTIVLRPLQNGTDITFALVSSPFGAVALGQGQATSTINTVDWSGAHGIQADELFGPSNQTVIGSFNIPKLNAFTEDVDNLELQIDRNLAAFYRVIPFMESLATAGTHVNDLSKTGFSPERFRVLTTQGHVSFTGSSLNNSGVACTARVTHKVDTDEAFPLFQPIANYNRYDNSDGGTGVPTISAHYGPISNKLNSTGDPEPTQRATPYPGMQMIVAGCDLQRGPPTTFSDISALAGCRVFPARESVQLINPPSSFEYQDIRKLWCPFFWKDGEDGRIQRLPPTTAMWLADPIYCFGGMANEMKQEVGYPPILDPTMTRVLPIPGLGHAPVTYYSASGLSPDSTITVTVRTCVEYTLQFSSSAARFAVTPPPARPAVLRTVQDVGKKLPSSQPVTPVTEGTGWLSSAISWYGNTMKNIVGASWDIGGQVARNLIPGVSGHAIANLTSRTGRLMIGK